MKGESSNSIARLAADRVNQWQINQVTLMLKKFKKKRKIQFTR